MASRVALSVLRRPAFALNGVAALARTNAPTLRAMSTVMPHHNEPIIDAEIHMPPPKPIDRTGETVEVTRKRLVYQSRKRGMLENDLLLSTFAEIHLPTMTAEELHLYDKLLDENDWDIYYWVTGKRPIPDQFNHGVMQKLIEYSKNERRALLRMPNLAAQ